MLKRLWFSFMLITLFAHTAKGVKPPVKSLATVASLYQRYDAQDISPHKQTNSSLFGLTIYEEVGKNHLEIAKRLLKADLKNNTSPSINHWWLAKLALRQKKISDFKNHLEQVKGLAFLKNTAYARELYDALPLSQRAWLVKAISNAGYFENGVVSACPYFELKKRKDRADFLYVVAKNHQLNKQVQERVFYELYIAMPEAINEENLRALNGFSAYSKKILPQDLIKRMENLLIFGKNSEARSTFEARISQKEPALTKAEQCELHFVDAKVDRKLKKFDVARTRFKLLSSECPEETQVKARYLDLMLAAQRGDEDALPLFSSFVDRYKDHSFADDVLLFKANLLLDKKNYEGAFNALDQIIQLYPHGDMIERALFLKAYHLAKQNETKRALESFHALLKTTVQGQLEHAQAHYWIARLTLFPDLFVLDNPHKTNLESAKKILEDLVNLSSPNVYSWLSYGLLTRLGVKVVVSHGASDKTSDDNLAAVQVNQDLIGLENLVMRGFRNEAIALLGDLPTNNANKTHGVRMAQLFDALNQHAAGHQKLVRCNFVLAQALKKEVSSIYRKISYPRPFAKEVSFATTKVDIPADIIFAIMRQESGFIPESVSWAGARGLMQLMYPSALGQAHVWGIKNLQENDLFLPEVNVLLATSLLQSYWQQFGSIAVGLAAYNAGPHMAKAWFNKNKGGSLDTFVEEISFKETRDYVKSVLGNIFAYIVFSTDKSSPSFNFDHFASIK